MDGPRVTLDYVKQGLINLKILRACACGPCELAFSRRTVMGLESKRYNGRCPSYVVGALIIISLFLTLKLWSVTLLNNDLLMKLETFGEALKIT